MWLRSDAFAMLPNCAIQMREESTTGCQCCGSPAGFLPFESGAHLWLPGPKWLLPSNLFLAWGRCLQWDIHFPVGFSPTFHFFFPSLHFVGWAHGSGASQPHTSGAADLAQLLKVAFQSPGAPSDSPLANATVKHIPSLSAFWQGNHAALAALSACSCGSAGPKLPLMWCRQAGPGIELLPLLPGTRGAASSGQTAPGFGLLRVCHYCRAKQK